MKIKYDDLVDLDKIKKMYLIIRKNTKNKYKLFRFEMFYLCNIMSIYQVLKNHKYDHTSYNIFLIKEPKYRIIMSETLSDKIINHLVSEYVLKPLIEPKLIEQNVATRKNKGTMKGFKYTKKYINHLKLKYDKIYVLKCDIKKYFYHIDHEILLNKLKNIIKDKEIYKLINNILYSTNKEYVNRQIKKVIEEEIQRLNKLNILDKKRKIEELRNIPTYKIGKGLPIGNMTSQILAIYYLNDIDHYIKEQLHCKYYIRYMDDFIIFDYNKERLKRVRVEIEKKIQEEKLELNHKTNIYDLNHGFQFLGYYYILKNKKLIIKINNKTKRRIKKKMIILKKKKVSNYNQIKTSYMGYFKYANSNNFLFHSRF